MAQTLLSVPGFATIENRKPQRQSVRPEHRQECLCHIVRGWRCQGCRVSSSGLPVHETTRQNAQSGKEDMAADEDRLIRRHEDRGSYVAAIRRHAER